MRAMANALASKLYSQPEPLGDPVVNTTGNAPTPFKSLRNVVPIAPAPNSPVMGQVFAPIPSNTEIGGWNQNTENWGQGSGLVYQQHLSVQENYGSNSANVTTPNPVSPTNPAAWWLQ